MLVHVRGHENLRDDSTGRPNRIPGPTVGWPGVRASTTARRTARSPRSWFRAGVFGASDGLVTNVSLILGFAGRQSGPQRRSPGRAGGPRRRRVLDGQSASTSRCARRRSLLEYEIEVERRSLRDSPVEEREELRAIFESTRHRGRAGRPPGDGPHARPRPGAAHARARGVGRRPVGDGLTRGRRRSRRSSRSASARLIPLLPWLRDDHGQPDRVVDRPAASVASLASAAVIGWFTRRGIDSMGVAPVRGDRARGRRHLRRWATGGFTSAVKVHELVLADQLKPRDS